MARRKSSTEYIEYRILFEQSPYGVLIIDSDGRILDFNEAAHNQLGYSREEFAKLCIADIDPVESHEEIQNKLDEIVAKGQAEHEVKHKTRHGDVRDVHVITRVLKLSGKTIFHSIWRDITEQKLAERVIRNSEEKFRTLFDSANDAIFILDLNGNFIDVNKTAYSRLGYTKDEMLSMHVTSLHAPALAGKVPEKIALVREQGHGVVFSEHVRKDGTVMPVEINAKVIDYDGKKAIFSIIRDISERRRDEEARVRSEKRFHALFNNTPLGIVAVGTDRRIIDCNAAFQKMVGYTMEELLCKSIPDISHPGDDLATRDYYKEMVEGKRDSFTVDKRHIRKNGTIFWTTLTGTVIRDARNNPEVVFGIVEDITERKKLEEALRSSKEFIERILNTVDEVFIVIDRDYRILLANNAYVEQTAMSLNDIIGRRCHEISHGTPRPCYEDGEDCVVRHAFHTGEPHTAVHRHKDTKDAILYVETKAFPIKDSTGAVTSVIETVNNITEKHLLEEERLKTQKLEAVGTLAGGIAHDFNNLLQGVFGYISMAKMALDQKERATAMLEQAEQALRLSVNLTAQLLTFSKGGKPVMKKVALKQVIENSVRFALSGSSVDYRLMLDEDLWLVEADEGQVGQVIQNIVLNADQAMPLGGTIVITAKNVREPKEGLPKLSGGGKHVVISVQDCGIGIPGQYLSRIFDPYFTTKEKGSGLGLATAYSIIRNHGGLLDVASEVGKGTAFFIYLPAVEAEKGAEAEPEPPPVVRKGKVLVMDDEQLVCNIAGEMILALGHAVDFAENGEAAIEKYRAGMESGEPFDIVILDLTIRGGMGGEEAIERLRMIDPGVRAIVSSGYSDNAVVSDFKKYGFMARMTKPYKLEELRDKLNSLLS